MLPGATATDSDKQDGQHRLHELQSLLQRMIGTLEEERCRVSIAISQIGEEEPIFLYNPDEHRTVASNVKLFTSTAAVLSLSRRYTFVTEILQRKNGGAIYLRGNGDPILSGKEINRLAERLRVLGVTHVRGVVVDDSQFDRRRLAPGFESFSEGAYYRPTSGAVNIDGNAVVIKVSGPQERRRPRVDVLPPSDYVKVRKKVQFYPVRKRARSAVRTKISIDVQPRGSIMWLTIGGRFRRGDRPWSTRRAIYDPGLNAGWVLRRALKNVGMHVEGIVRRGRCPKDAKTLVRKSRSMRQILTAIDQHSDNLAAENVVRAMGMLSDDPRHLKKIRALNSWDRGLRKMQEALNQLGIFDFYFGNGSGLHRKSWTTARTLVELLQKVWYSEKLNRALLPTLSVAGVRGTLGNRMKGTSAEGLVHAKTGTLNGALALSGFVAPESKSPIVFSIIVNGRSDHIARDQIDQIAALLANYQLGGPLVQASSPSTQPAEEKVEETNAGTESDNLGEGPTTEAQTPDDSLQKGPPEQAPDSNAQQHQQPKQNQPASLPAKE